MTYLPWTWIIVVMLAAPFLVWWFTEEAVSLFFGRDEKGYLAGFLAAGLTFFSLLTLIFSARALFVIGAIITLILVGLPSFLHFVCLVGAAIYTHFHPPPLVAEINETLASGKFDAERLTQCLQRSVASAPHGLYKAERYRKRLNQLLDLLQTHFAIASNLEAYERLKNIMEATETHERPTA